MLRFTVLANQKDKDLLQNKKMFITSMQLPPVLQNKRGGVNEMQLTMTKMFPLITIN